MEEVPLVIGEGDRELRERLDQEIIAFNVAVTGYHDARLLSIAARGSSGDLRGGLSGWTWGGCGHVELLWVRDDQRGNGLGTRLLAAAEACGAVAVRQPWQRAAACLGAASLDLPVLEVVPATPSAGTRSAA